MYHKRLFNATALFSIYHYSMSTQHITVLLALSYELRCRVSYKKPAWYWTHNKIHKWKLSLNTTHSVLVYISIAMATQSIGSNSIWDCHNNLLLLFYSHREAAEFCSCQIRRKFWFLLLGRESGVSRSRFTYNMDDFQIRPEYSCEHNRYLYRRMTIH